MNNKNKSEKALLLNSGKILNQLVKDPSLNIILAALNIKDIIQNYSDQILLNKLKDFLYPLLDWEPDKIKSYFDQNFYHNKKRSNFARNIVFAIDSVDQESKSTIIGRLLRCLINEEISLNQFNRLVKGILRVNVFDLPLLIELNREHEDGIDIHELIDKEGVYELQYSGFLENLGVDGGGFVNVRIEVEDLNFEDYKITPMARKLLDLNVLDEELSTDRDY